MNIARQKAVEYTPTTATLREAYWRSQSRSVAHADAQFDRWLASVEAAVRADQIEKDAAIAEAERERWRPGLGNYGRDASERVAAAIRAQLEGTTDE